MRPSPWQRFDLVLRHLLPVLSLVFLELMTVAPTHIAHFSTIAPMLTLIGVYYWTVHRPDLLGYGSVFVIGVFSDLVGGVPLGVTSFMLLLTHGLVESQYKFFRGKTFAVMWWAFLLVAAAGIIAQYLAMFLVYGRLLDTRAVLASYLMTVACYPLVAWLLGRAHLVLLREV